MNHLRDEQGRFVQGHFATPEIRVKMREAHKRCRDLFGERNPRWRGGRRVDKGGYIRIYSREHPFAAKDRCVYEHRLVMEKKIGRYLRSYEVVHHINGVKKDNRIENLELLPSESKHNNQVQKVYQENKRLKEENKMLKLLLKEKP